MERERPDAGSLTSLILEIDPSRCRRFVAALTQVADGINDDGAHEAIDTRGGGGGFRVVRPTPAALAATSPYHHKNDLLRAVSDHRAPSLPDITRVVADERESVLPVKKKGTYPVRARRRRRR